MIDAALKAATIIVSATLLATSAAAHDSLNPTMGTVERGAINMFTTPGNQEFSAAWVRKYFASAGQCLSLTIQSTIPFVDMELVVIGPDPSIRYRNDDSQNPSCTLCPSVRIDPVPITGNYTVIANHYSGAAFNAEFLLEVLRQNSGPTFCPNPTAPF